MVPIPKVHDLSVLNERLAARCLERLDVLEQGERAAALLAEAADTIQEYEARIAALERLVGKQALELEFLKGAQRQGRQPRSAPMSVITGPQASPSSKDAD